MIKVGNVIQIDVSDKERYFGIVYLTEDKLGPAMVISFDGKRKEIPQNAIVIVEAVNIEEYLKKLIVPQKHL